MYFANVAIGESLCDTYGKRAGKADFTYCTKAGQQELVRNPFSASSLDSACATISAPRAASITVGKIVRFTPSACNTQPWKATAEEKSLTVYRYKKSGKRGIMPADKVAHYNRIDIGIFLCFLDLCLMKNDISFERELFTDNAKDDCEEALTAKYTLLQ